MAQRTSNFSQAVTPALGGNPAHQPSDGQTQKPEQGSDDNGNEDIRNQHEKSIQPLIQFIEYQPGVRIYLVQELILCGVRVGCLSTGCRRKCTSTSCGTCESDNAIEANAFLGNVRPQTLWCEPSRPYCAML